MQASAVCRFQVILRHVSPRIWRRVEMPSGSSLADLQCTIQIVMGWSQEYQHRFCIRNHFLGTALPGELLLFGDPADMKLSQFGFRPNERFRYEYNFFDGWSFDIRFEGAQPLDPRRCYPRCVAGARRAPPEAGGGAELFMDHHPPHLPEVRKAWRLDRTLRRLAWLLEDPTLDDATLRARSRAILRERPAPEFDRVAVNTALLRAFSPRCKPVKETSHGDPHPGDH